jgi:hypothetical protein
MEKNTACVASFEENLILHHVTLPRIFKNNFHSGQLELTPVMYALVE